MAHLSFSLGHCILQFPQCWGVESIAVVGCVAVGQWCCCGASCSMSRGPPWLIHSSGDALWCCWRWHPAIAGHTQGCCWQGYCSSWCWSCYHWHWGLQVEWDLLWGKAGLVTNLWHGSVQFFLVLIQHHCHWLPPSEMVRLWCYW